MQSTLTPQAFVAKWKKSSLKESAGDREHFIDLCRLIGHDTPDEADSTGANFTFQYGAAKLGTGHSVVEKAHAEQPVQRAAHLAGQRAQEARPGRLCCLRLAG